MFSHRERPGRYHWIPAILGVVYLLSPGTVAGQTPQSTRLSDALHQLNDSIEALVQHVSPSVVQILVTGYGSAEDGDRKQTNDVIGRCQAVGSGVIVDPDGYIVTNAHVVNGAEKIEVIVPPRFDANVPPDPGQDTQGITYQARIVGATGELDLAVIKIEAHELSALSINGSIKPAKQGEIVFAFGSPEGLRNTVTMGVVSSVARNPTLTVLSSTSKLTRR
jgi:serine protease Do